MWWNAPKPWDYFSLYYLICLNFFGNSGASKKCATRSWWVSWWACGTLFSGQPPWTLSHISGWSYTSPYKWLKKWKSNHRIHKYVFSNTQMYAYLHRCIHLHWDTYVDTYIHSFICIIIAWSGGGLCTYIKGWISFAARVHDSLFTNLVCISR